MSGQDRCNPQAAVNFRFPPNSPFASGGFLACQQTSISPPEASAANC